MAHAFIRLRLVLNATIYPTLTVPRADWDDALSRARAGQKTVLHGITGGHGCRGERIPSQQDSVTITGAFTEEECASWGVECGAHGEVDFWGEVSLCPSDASDDGLAYY